MVAWRGTENVEMPKSHDLLQPEQHINMLLLTF